MAEDCKVNGRWMAQRNKTAMRAGVMICREEYAGKGQVIGLESMYKAQMEVLMG